MASQPLNTSINVFYRVRAQRALNLHRSVWEAGNGAGVNPLVTVVPGEEGFVSATRDAVNDIVTTTLSTGRNDGYAIVRYRLDAVNFGDTVSGLQGDPVTEETFKIVRIGKDAFIENKAAYAGNDLFGEVKAL